MTIAKIINWCIKHNYNNFTVQDCVNNNQRVKLEFTDYNIYSAVYNSVKKLKNVHIETWTIFLVQFDGCIYIYDDDNWNNIENYHNSKSELIDIFWKAKHAGCSSEDAKNKQYEYALKNNLIDIFNKIYD